MQRALTIGVTFTPNTLSRLVIRLGSGEVAHESLT